MHELNLQQKNAATAPLDPLLIIAGAGTGKTKTLIARIVHLLHTGARPEKICAVTFTNKAANEMADRVQKIIHNKKQPLITTFHSLGSRILRTECTALGRTRDFTIYDDQDSLRVVRGILSRSDGISKDKRSGHGPAFFTERISQAKNGMGITKDTHPRFMEIFRAYEEELKENNAFDFDDLIEKPIALLERDPVVREKYAQKYDHILVDEYQDINGTQYALVRLLAGAGTSVTVVGDDQQTIYTWRGSDPEVFRGFERDWPGARVVLLEENYRSSGNIIAAASAVIAHNTRDRKKKLWTKNPDGNPVSIVECSSSEEEASYIAEAARERTPGSVGILYRTNAQSRAIEQALIDRRVPYAVYGGLRFYDRREVRDVVAALRYAVNPRDAVGRERLEKAFPKGIFREVDRVLRESSGEPPARLINAFLSASNYFERLERSATSPRDREENIASLIGFASRFEDTRELLERVTLLQATDTLAREERAQVALLTMHLAKGLEFDRVFIAGAVEGVLPHARSIGSMDEIEEERRLMYVAMTRARQALSICFYDIPSRFIGEIPQELTEFRSLCSDDTSFSDDEERYITLD